VESREWAVDSLPTSRIRRQTTDEKRETRHEKPKTLLRSASPEIQRQIDQRADHERDYQINDKDHYAHTLSVKSVLWGDVRLAIFRLG
jgi:hypothetical protein